MRKYALVDYAKRLSQEQELPGSLRQTAVLLPIGILTEPFYPAAQLFQGGLAIQPRGI